MMMMEEVLILVKEVMLHLLIVVHLYHVVVKSVKDRERERC